MPKSKDPTFENIQKLLNAFDDAEVDVQGLHLGVQEEFIQFLHDKMSVYDLTPAMVQTWQRKIDSMNIPTPEEINRKKLEILLNAPI